MKTFESFRVAGFGDMGDAKTAEKKLVKNVEEIYKAVKKGNYKVVMSRFSKSSVEYAFAKALEDSKRW